MTKQISTSKAKSSRKILITDAKALLKELNKLSKYRNGVKVSPDRREVRYQSLPPFTGHLSFRDVIKVVNKFASEPKVPAKAKTTKAVARKAVRVK